ncbi:hypothetical protein IAU59_007523 [Kwoniella sp. CBS 9459]
MTKSVLIIGAGELGLSIVSAMLAHPSKPSVSVLLREGSSSISTLSELYGDSVKIIHGDISSSVDAIAALLRGYDIVVSATGFSSGPGSQLKLAQAALQAQVGHYVPWQFGVDYDIIGRGSSQPLFDEQLDVRDLLRNQPQAQGSKGGQGQVPWTIVSTGLFTSFLFDPAFGVVTKDKETSTITVKALGSFGNRLTITSAENIGRYTSRILLDDDDDNSPPPEGVVFVADETITFGQVAEALEAKVKGVGWKVERTEASIEELEEALQRNKDDVGAKYSLIWARAKGVAWDKEGTWNWKNGLKGETLDQWVEKNFTLP